MFKMVNAQSCSMFHLLGNGTVEQNYFYGTSRGTEVGTPFQKALFPKGLKASRVEHVLEQSWNKYQKTWNTPGTKASNLVPRPLRLWNKIEYGFLT